MDGTIRHRRISALALAILVAQGTALTAQTAAAVAADEPYLRLRLVEDKTVQGYLASADGERLVLREAANRQALVVPLSSVAVAERRAIKSHSGTGAVVGAVCLGLPLALFSGFAAGWNCSEGGGPCSASEAVIGGAVLGAALGGAIGSGLGALVRKETWVPFDTRGRSAAILTTSPHGLGVRVSIRF